MRIRKILVQMLVAALIIMALALVNGGEVKAALQSNPSTQYKKTDTMANWLPAFRNMEATGGAMGLNETINSSTLLASTSSNNIDVHLMKSTEWGAMAILSSSAYGNPSNEKLLTSTTGNETGVILDGNHYEWVAGGYKDAPVFSGKNARYYDSYGSDANATKANGGPKTGDALGTGTTEQPGCRGWHKASGSGWVYDYSDFGGKRVYTWQWWYFLLHLQQR